MELDEEGYGRNVGEGAGRSNMKVDTKNNRRQNSKVKRNLESSQRVNL